MKTDVRGKVANVKLGRTRCLQPLFEAIMNAIHAVQEAKPDNGRIDVEVIRNTSQQELFEGNPTNFPITGFIVRDNGVGFTDKHFESFNTADTTEKALRGGKGVGRFLWLKAFERAEVRSVFRSNGTLQQRAFTFCLSRNGIDPPAPDADSTEDSEPNTEVTLSGFRTEYQRHCPKTAVTIAHRIIEHFLEWFILKKCPTIVLTDDIEDTSLDLNRTFDSDMKIEAKTQRFSIRDMKFRLHHVRLASQHAQQHTLSFCAHGRSVRTDALVKLAPYLDPSIPDKETGDHFIYAGYVSGEFLDENVMSERTQFDISEERSAIEFPDELGWPDLIDATLPKIQKFLKPHVAPLGEAKLERIRQYIMEKAAQYRHLLTQCKEAVKKIPSNLSDDKLDLELYKIDQQHDLELKAQYEKLLAAGDSKTLTHEKQKQRFEKFLEDWNEAGMAKLARHVVHRKATLAFLEQRLALQDDGKAKDRNGRPIIVPPGTPFYGYIVCDMMPKLEEQAKYAQLTKTPDGMGYFGYNAQVGVYVEIVSFAKLVDDAKKRNTAFFEKLGIGK